MLEGVLALAGEAAAGPRGKQVLLLERLRASRRRRSPSSAAGRAQQRPPRSSGRRPRRDWSSRRSRRRSESSRAASSDWTVSGSAPGVGVVLLEQPVDHLLGEQRVAAGALGDLGDDVRGVAAGAGVERRRPARASRPAVSGSSAIEVALRRPPPQPGRRSSSSSRARQTISSGARTQRARCSIRSSIPSSAQWMSSIASTQRAAARDRLDVGAGRRRRALRASAGDPGFDGCSPSGGSRPSRMASEARRCSRPPPRSLELAHQLGRRRREASPRRPSGASVSRIPNSSLSTSASAQ